MNTKALRQKILDLAIHGKLVPQDPNDEPASVLLERIKAEKERLIKEGKIKRTKRSKTACDKPHYPFELPKGWCWTTLGEISNYGTTINIQVENIEKNEWILELEDVEKETANIIQKLSKGERSVKGTRHKFNTGDILYSKLRTYLNKVLVATSEGYCTTEIMPLNTYGIMSNEYVCHVLRSPFFLDYTLQCGYGVKMPRLSTTDACNGFIPLPPLKEQIRIVEEIRRWFALIDIIESGKDDLQETIKQTKSKILNLAIHGKLVPQDPTDEPATELLKRINPKAEITCDNPHYRNLPKGWAVIKVGNVAKYTNGRAFKPEEWESTGLPIIRIQNLNDADAPYNRSSVIHEQKYLIKDGDLLFAWAASIGTYIWSGENAWLNQHIFKVEPYPFIDKAFLFYAFQAMISEFYKNSHGSGMVHITKKQFEEITLLLPPLSEQIRIVECLEQIFSILDSINCNL